MSSTVPIEVEVVHTFDAVEDRADTWDAFMASQGCEVFLSFDWCRTWWKHYSHEQELAVLICSSAGNVVAILPLFIEPYLARPFSLRIAQLVGTLNMPVTVSLPIDRDFLLPVAEAMYDWLRQHRVEGLVLGDLSGKFEDPSQFLQALESAVSAEFDVALRERGEQTYFDIAENWTDQLAGLSKQERKRMRRVDKNLEAEGVSLRSEFATDSNVEAWFDEFVAMHQAHWQRQGKAGHFVAWPGASGFHREVAAVQLRKGRLGLLRIVVDGVAIGYKYTYRFGKICTGFLEARSADELPGQVSFSRLSFQEIIRKLQELRTVTLYDSMRGKYGHKLSLGGRMNQTHQILVVSRSRGVRLRMALLRTWATALDRIVVKAWTRRIAPRLGIAAHPFHQPVPLPSSPSLPLI